MRKFVAEPVSSDSSPTPISEVVRQRLLADGKRFFASDNVSDYLTDDERQELVDELTTKFEAVLDTLLIDRNNDPNSKDTGRRLAKMYIHELMEGRFYPAPNVTAFPNDTDNGSKPYKGMLVVRSEIKSMCSHHHQIVDGVCYIGIIPGSKVIGLSKYTRIAQHAARRGTLQEELCNDIADAIKEATGSSDVAVHITATHGCCQNRGIMAKNSATSTTVLSGQFFTSEMRQEFFNNIKMQIGGIV